MTGRQQDDLYGPPCPFELQYLWSMYVDLSATRQGGFGPQFITYQEIESYSRLAGICIEPWELRILIHLDRVSMSAHADKPKAATKK